MNFNFEFGVIEDDRSILVSVISICLFEKAAVLICIWTDSLQTRFSRGGRAKQHGPGPDKGQSSNAPAGGSRAGNAGVNNGARGKNRDRGNRGIGRGNSGRGDDDDHGRDAMGHEENGSYPRPEERSVIFLPIITGSIAYIVSLNDAELSTTGRVIRQFSMIINLVGFICCAVVLWQPYTNPRFARLMNPRVATILSRIGSALAVLGFLSTIAIDLPTYLSWISGLAFMFVLAMFLVDMLA